MLQAEGAEVRDRHAADAERVRRRSTASSCAARPGRSTPHGCASGPAITASWPAAGCCPARSSPPATTSARNAAALRDDRRGRGRVPRRRRAAVRQLDGPGQPDRGRRGDRAHLSAPGAHAVQRHRPSGAGDDVRAVAATACRSRCSSSAGISRTRPCCAWPRPTKRQTPTRRRTLDWIDLTSYRAGIERSGQARTSPGCQV